MTKKKGFAPYIFLGPMPTPGPGDDNGNDTDGGGVDPVPGNNVIGPVSYRDWVSYFGTEENGGSVKDRYPSVTVPTVSRSRE